MAKRPKNNLTAILQQSEGELHALESTKPDPKPDPVVVSNNVESKRPACREGKKVVMCHVDEDVNTLLEYLKIERKASKQELLCEAINLLLVKYDKPPIA
ncbi:hypothetical protein F4Z99_20230 [Candidatus Poribacteria bacterium]|nr:hypothetical protein [Candidatus Poribacteria bacterium]MYA99332.1 hypothetical protein [Candidatus Poribacteria bacterium]